MRDIQLKPFIEKIYPSIRAIRRTIHQYPELSGQEFATAQLIARELRSLGLKPRFYAGKTGVAAELSHGRGKTIVLRADTDALPMVEQNKVPYASSIEGVMHACGHDMHTACLLGAARLLVGLRERLQGRVVFLFQPSEEAEPGGALAMIKEGAFPADTAAAFGLHVSMDHASGQIGIKAGNECSAVCVFNATVHGRGGHGALPERTVDPIVTAATMIMHLQTLVSRETAAFEPLALSVCTLNAGSKNNVIPDSASFSGTMRTFSGQTQALLMRRMRESLAALAKASRARVEIQFLPSYPAGFNDPELARRAGEAFVNELGKRSVVQRPAPAMFSEDFTYYQQQCPGLFVHLGARPAGVKAPEGLHSAAFLPDEEALKTGMAAHTLFALELLKRV
jgi:amidohydrolase